MPLIIFTYTTGAMTREKAVNVSRQIRESVVKNYVVKNIPDGLRAHTRMKVLEIPRECYIGADDNLPLYDVELVGPIDSVVGSDAEAFARDVTMAILTAEGADLNEENAERVWCTISEMQDGKWMIGPKVLGRRSTLKHILKHQFKSSRDLRHAAE